MAMDAPPAIICQAPRVIDGDSIRCENIGKQVRLAGIDAPEMPGKCRPGRKCAPGNGQVAKRMLERILAKGLVYITPAGRDRYGRIIARVKIGRIDASCEMVKRGQAVYRYGRIDCPLPRVRVSS